MESNMNAHDPITSLRSFANEKLIELPHEIKFNTSNYVRFAAKGKVKDDFYRFVKLDHHIYGWFGTWKGGKKIYRFQSWQGSNPDLEAKIEAIKLDETEERRLESLTAAEIAEQMWENAPAASEAHPYLVRKNVLPVGGIRSAGDHILIPLRDNAGKIWSLQSIDSEGGKRFTPGSSPKGKYFLLSKESRKIIVCEGYATGASIYQNTPYSVAVAFSSEWVTDCAKEVKKAFPHRVVELAQDLGKAGDKSAQAWAREIGSQVHKPEFKEGEPFKDFNDLAQIDKKRVQKCFDKLAVKTISLASAKKEDFPKRPFIVDPFMRERSIGMIYSQTGGGKTLFTLSLCMHISKGLPFLGWKTEKKKVLYIDSEMEMDDVLNLRDWVCFGNSLELEDTIRVMNRASCPEQFVNTNSLQWQERIMEEAEKYDVVVVDNLSTCFGTKGGDENKSEYWEPLKDFFFSLRFGGKSVIYVHHAGKGGDQRGTSARKDAADYVIRLQKQEDKADGIEIKLKGKFEKGRRGDYEEFGCQVHTDGLWESIDAGKSMEKEVLERFHAGESRQSIEKSMGMGWHRVNRIIKEAGETRSMKDAARMRWAKVKNLGGED